MEPQSSPASLSFVYAKNLECSTRLKILRQTHFEMQEHTSSLHSRATVKYSKQKADPLQKLTV
jgi:hypothetical protein